MKLKLIAAFLLLSALAGAGWFFFVHKDRTQGIHTQIDVVSNLVTKLKTRDTKPGRAGSGKDPEAELQEFTTYLESGEPANAISRYRIKDALRFHKKPSPRYETRLDVVFDFNAIGEAEKIINDILMQRKFFVRFDDFNVKTLKTGKLRGTLSVTHVLHTDPKARKDSIPKSLVVLLESPDGTVGKIEVSNQYGSQVVDKKGYAVSLENTGKAPAKPFAVNRTKLRQILRETTEAKTGQPVTFVLYFESGKTRLTTKSRDTIPRIISTIKARSRPKVEISGHSDRSGEKSFNEKLALERARAVEKLLRDAGINGARITDVSSLGERNPIIRTADGVVEPRNRRVEVIVE